MLYNNQWINPLDKKSIEQNQTLKISKKFKHEIFYWFYGFNELERYLSSDEFDFIKKENNSNFIRSYFYFWQVVISKVYFHRWNIPPGYLLPYCNREGGDIGL